MVSKSFPLYNICQNRYEQRQISQSTLQKSTTTLTFHKFFLNQSGETYSTFHNARRHFNPQNSKGNLSETLFFHSVPAKYRKKRKQTSTAPSSRPLAIHRLDLDFKKATEDSICPLRCKFSSWNPVELSYQSSTFNTNLRNNSEQQHTLKLKLPLRVLF